MVHNFAKP